MRHVHIFRTNVRRTD